MSLGVLAALQIILAFYPRDRLVATAKYSKLSFCFEKKLILLSVAECVKKKV